MRELASANPGTILHVRGVESLSAVHVTGSVGVCGALGACKKHVKSYNTAKFDSLKDALLAGPRGTALASCYRVLHFRRVFAKVCAKHKK